MFCTKCGAEIAEGSKFCPRCGARQATPTPYCSKCGTEVPEGSEFCPNCGIRVAAPRRVAPRAPAEAERVVLGTPEILALVGALAMLAGPFLLWMKTLGVSLQGLDWSTGPALFVLGALCFAALILVRNREPLSGLAYVGLGLCGLALIGHFIYCFYDAFNLNWGVIREGFYVAGTGSLLVFAGGITRLLMRA